MKLKKYLSLWVSKDLISDEQSKNIIAFMKERQKEQFFRFLKWLSILGALWIIFGVITLVYNLFQLDFMEKILSFLLTFFANISQFLHQYIFSPIYNLVYSWFGKNSGYFFSAISCFILFVLFSYLSRKIKNNPQINSLNITEEQKRILKTNYFIEFSSCISLSAVFCFLNMLIIPHDSYYSDNKIFPIFNVLGAIYFMFLAYKNLKPLFLFFGIYFIALSSGLFFGYGYACYWIGASKPIVQSLVGFILILVGYITTMQNLQNEEEDSKKINVKEKFASIYNSFGLFILFISLWIMSFWGFDFDRSIFSKVPASELWMTNILFIVCSILAMYYGAKSEQKIFFNYGLTFILIETYTVFCSRLFGVMPVGIASLLLGLLLFMTGKLLQKIYIKSNIDKK